MNFQTDHYEFELPDGQAADILASIADADLRGIILRMIDETPDGEPVRLPLEYGDVVLHALSEWERADMEQLSEYDRNYFEWQEGGE